MSDPALILLSDMHGLAGREAELRALLDELADGTRTEPECLSFRVLADGDPGEFVLLVAWSSEAAMRAHYDTDHYRRYRESVGQLLARPSDVVIYHVSGTVHAADPNPPDPGMLG
jgi:quinol monooxygenase YgiN